MWQILNLYNVSLYRNENKSGFVLFIHSEKGKPTTALSEIEFEIHPGLC